MLNIPEVMNAEERKELLEDLMIMSDYFCQTKDEIHDSFEQRVESIVKRALALYNETEPRLMKSIEVFGPGTDGLVYIEGFGCITPALVTDKTREVDGATERWIATQQMSGEWLREDYYGKVWRCWTKRPSEEQCRVTKWQE